TGAILPSETWQRAARPGAETSRDGGVASAARPTWRAERGTCRGTRAMRGCEGRRSRTGDPGTDDEIRELPLYGRRRTLRGNSATRRRRRNGTRKAARGAAMVQRSSSHATDPEGAGATRTTAPASRETRSTAIDPALALSTFAGSSAEAGRGDA